MPVFNRGMSPNKLFDYLAAGLPVASNARVPLAAVIKDDEVGRLTDPDKLHQGVTSILSADDATKQRWKQYAQHLSGDVYSREKQRIKVESLLNDLVRTRHRGGSQNKARRRLWKGRDPHKA